ncbi:wyosine [tRNA(Phe)-imidazoG37] synthetase, radical SAM superfamily [Campylobacter sp. RM5004]|uniref:radical SAM protein n=1 Tax=Campylobacter sp. RM5004 TaxID=1660078 RepID=UPI001EFABE60|nr:radical SAM protein [Campylobacter sp. RM5004]ULO01422.1 wyosine [tRNA(Phe)-imidazoG37] synthetase, radical SAM superfamily [Campylobacter sp. RM5004]
MKVIFGPINSRRFKKSLGIDLSPNEKCCNFDCLYCELGKAKIKHKNEANLSVEYIISELKKALDIHKDLDYISISANGEPTLYPNLKELILEINKIKKNAKSLILSNASTIFDENIQKALLELDAVKLSLDSVNEKVFRKIDRSNINLSKIIQGIINFSNIYKGELVLECLVLEGINDNKEDFIALNEILKNIKASRLDLGTIDRPSDYDVKAVSFEKLQELASLLTNINVNIISRTINEKIYDDLLKTLELRPLSEDEISINDKELLKELLEKNIVKLAKINDINFYKLNK